MISFLKSRRNRILVSIIIFFLIALLLQITLSFIIYKSKNKIVTYLNEILGYTITLDNIEFGFLKGLHLKGLSVFYNNQRNATLFFKDIYIHTKIITSILKNEIVIGRINLNEGILLSRKEREGINFQIIFSDVYKNITDSKSTKLRISINDLTIRVGLLKVISINDEFNSDGTVILLKNIHISMNPFGKVKFKSNLRFTSKLPEENYLSGFLKNKNIIQDLKYFMEGTISNKNMIVDSMLLKLGKEQIIGSGLIKDFAERNPYIDIRLMASIISINNIAFINENFNIEGYLSLSLMVNGLLDNMKLFLNGNVYDCNVKYQLRDNEILNIDNINGVIEYKNQLINFKNINLKLNNLPLNIKLKIDLNDPHILLTVSLFKDFLTAQNIPLQNLEVMFKGKVKERLTGDLEIKTTYIRNDQNFTMQAKLNNIEFDYSNLKEKYFKIDKIDFIKDNIENIQKLNFENFNSKVELYKNRINIKEINFQGYNGRLNGQINIDLKDKLMLNFFLNGRQLDIRKLTHGLRLTNKFLSGNLDTKITFNNYSKEFLRGNCYIKDGIIDLSALTEFVKVPALENVSFEIAHIYFGVSKNIVKIRGIKLSSQDIKLNAYWDIKNKIDGALNIKISSTLLNNSPEFRRLLTLAEIKKPYIDFRFLLGGIPKTMRLIWMKGEFKERLEEELPTWVKKKIEMNLDKMINDLSSR